MLSVVPGEPSQCHRASLMEHHCQNDSHPIDCSDCTIPLCLQLSPAYHLHQCGMRIAFRTTSPAMGHTSLASSSASREAIVSSTSCTYLCTSHCEADVRCSQHLSIGLHPSAGQSRARQMYRHTNVAPMVCALMMVSSQALSVVAGLACACDGQHSACHPDLNKCIGW